MAPGSWWWASPAARPPRKHRHLPARRQPSRLPVRWRGRRWALLGAGARTRPSPGRHPRRPAVGRFAHDVLVDYTHHISKETALWYGGGGSAAALVHPADEEIREALEDPPSATQTALEGGDHYGNLSLQVPLAVAWWAIGALAHSPRTAAAGRDLVRAQICATSWAYVRVNRDRPNGEPRSFPCGHAAATFATAMVIQEHYGWKLGTPFFAASTCTAVSRITVNKHWASDVTFGAFVGIASARTVTMHLRRSRFALVPLAVSGRRGIALVRVGQPAAEVRPQRARRTKVP